MITSINEFRKINEGSDWMASKVPVAIDAVAKALNGKAEFIEKVKGNLGLGSTYTGSKWNLFDDKGNVLLVTIKHVKVPGAPRFNDNEVILHDPTDPTKGIRMYDPYTSDVVLIARSQDHYEIISNTWKEPCLVIGELDGKAISRL